MGLTGLWRFHEGMLTGWPRAYNALMRHDNSVMAGLDAGSVTLFDVYTQAVQGKMKN